MNLQAMVQTALHAVPSGIAGTATITRTTPGTLDPLTDTRTGDTSASFTAPVILVTPRPGQFAPMPHVDEAREAVIAAADCTFPITPGLTMAITGDATTWRVTAVTTIAPGGDTVLAYRAQVRSVGTTG